VHVHDPLVANQKLIDANIRLLTVQPCNRIIIILHGSLCINAPFFVFSFCRMSNCPKSELCRRIGCEVFKRRQEKGWSQEELSVRAHCTRNTISFVERGHNNVSADLLLRLANAFGTNIHGFSGSAKI